METSVLKLDLDSPVPFDEQIKKQITRLVQSKTVRSGKRLPTVRELSLEMEINSNELTRICRRLEEDGYLLKKRGTGTYAVFLKEGAGSVSQHEEVYAT